MPAASSAIGHAEVWIPWILTPEERTERRYHLVAAIGRLRADRSTADANTELATQYDVGWPATIPRRRATGEGGRPRPRRPGARRPAPPSLPWRGGRAHLRCLLPERRRPACSLVVRAPAGAADAARSRSDALAARRAARERERGGGDSPAWQAPSSWRARASAARGADRCTGRCLRLRAPPRCARGRWRGRPLRRLRCRDRIGSGLRVVRSASRMAEDTRSTRRLGGRTSMAAQVAVTLLVAVIGTALVDNVRALTRLTHADSAPAAGHRIVLPGSRYADEPSQRAFFERLLAALRGAARAGIRAPHRATCRRRRPRATCGSPSRDVPRPRTRRAPCQRPSILTPSGPCTSRCCADG